ncbi:MAG: DUF4236 domain-containing protein [Pseudomonadota bacterium]
MGFRFRRSIRLLPGIRVNLGKRGASLSLGRRGAHVTIGPTGTRTTVGLPGTGLSYTHLQRPRGPIVEDAAGEDGAGEDTARTASPVWRVLLLLVLGALLYRLLAG